MTRIAWFAVSLLVPTVGCSRTKAASATVPGFGEVMSQVGHRFEMAGRAAKANRFEMAAFEVGKLKGLCGTDVPRAPLPKEVPTAQSPSLAHPSSHTLPPQLTRPPAS